MNCKKEFKKAFRKQEGKDWLFYPKRIINLPPKNEYEIIVNELEYIEHCFKTGLNSLNKIKNLLGGQKNGKN
ncbi:MAG: hypothetical protein AABY22_17270 [Nanoarchaeota archaeon]